MTPVGFPVIAPKLWLEIPSRREIEHPDNQSGSQVIVSNDLSKDPNPFCSISSLERQKSSVFLGLIIDLSDQVLFKGKRSLVKFCVLAGTLPPRPILRHCRLDNLFPFFWIVVAKT